jgi:ribonuclease VapC
VIVVDTSALFAIAAHESERPSFIEVLDSDKGIISAVNYVETVMVLTGRSSRLAIARVDDLMRSSGIDLVAVDQRIAGAAVDGFDRYGKGRHPAGLNICDCFSYGLAKARGLPLLFKGNDFSKTDIVPAWRP